MAATDTEQLTLFDLGEYSGFRLLISSEEIDEAIEDLRHKTDELRSEIRKLELEHHRLSSDGSARQVSAGAA
ncbi:MAG: hypothetical protein QGI83_07600 [Candidatus Latescibacteria bacterium]|jgi:hypothetical protein|nr:hypothetical protein [Candidatus Latescibacterota bacterium]